MVHDQSFKQMLVPGEMARFDRDLSELSVSKDSNYKYTSWKDGELIFKNDQMNEVLEKLERWYNIKIEVKNKKIYQMIFNATIVNENVNEIFALIKYSCGIDYQIIQSHDPSIPVKVILTKE
jgi:transmembrane sensor